MRFIDTHAHIDFLLSQSHQSLSDFYTECQNNAVWQIILMGVYDEQFRSIIDLTTKQATLFKYALGLHPIYLDQHQKSDLDKLSKCLEQKSSPLVAVGEIGLDKYLTELNTPEKWQLQCDYFEAQLQLAQTFQLPVCIHARRCHNEVFSFLKNHQLQGVIHGFAGSYQEAKRYVDIGFKIGVGGTITYDRATKTRNAIGHLPIEALVLESDAPDMPVYQQQGQLNHPKNIVVVFHALKKLFGIDPEILVNKLWQNSCSLFNLSLSNSVIVMN